jgi:hypothetical protein
MSGRWRASAAGGVETVEKPLSLNIVADKPLIFKERFSEKI